MTITVKCFAALREQVDTDSCVVMLTPGATAADVRTALLMRYPGLQAWMPYVRVALNQDYHSWDTPLRDGDELALIPPVSGG